MQKTNQSCYKSKITESQWTLGDVYREFVKVEIFNSEPKTTRTVTCMSRLLYIFGTVSTNLYYSFVRY